MTDAGGGSSHAVQFYKNEAELVPVLAKYVGTALRLGHDAIVIARPGLCGKLGGELQRIELERLSASTARGTLIALDAQATLDRFMVDGWPDPSAFEEHVASFVKNATAGGKSVVAFGEMVALLCEQGHYAAALQLEKVWNDLLARFRFSLLCAYPLRLFTNKAGQGHYSHVCAVHQQVSP